MQKVFEYECCVIRNESAVKRDAKFKALIEEEGWKIVNSTPILSDYGGTSHTSRVIYILEKEEKEGLHL